MEQQARMADQTIQTYVKQHRLFGQLYWLTNKRRLEVERIVDHDGRIDSEGRLSILIKLETSPPSLINYFALDSLTLLATLEDPAEPTSIKLEVFASLRDPKRLNAQLIMARLYWDVEDTAFNASVDSTSAPNFAELTWRAGNEDLVALADVGPAGFADLIPKTLENFQVELTPKTILQGAQARPIYFAYNLVDGHLAFSVVNVALAAPNVIWEIAEDVAISDLRLMVAQNWRVDGTHDVDGTPDEGPRQLISGTFLLGRHQSGGKPTPLNVSFSLPSLILHGELDTRQGFESLANLMENVGLGCDFWPNHLYISRLSFTYIPKPDFLKEFALDFSGQWEILPNIQLEYLSADAAITRFQSSFTLSALFRLLKSTTDELAIDLIADFQADDDTRSLTFTGTVRPDSAIHLGALVDDLLVRVGLEWGLPDALHDLSVSDLEVELEVVEQTTRDQDGQSLSETWKRLSVGFTIGAGTGSWELFPGLFSLQPARVSLSLGGGLTELRIRETATLFGVVWLAQVQLPAMRGSLEMIGEGSKLSELLDFFHLPTAGLEAAQLAAASAAFDAQARTMALHLELSNPWSLGGLTLNQVGIDLVYQGGQDGGTTAQLAAAAQIRDDLSLYVTAEHAGPGMGWQIAGGLTTQAHHKLSLREALTRFGLAERELDPVAAFSEISLLALSIAYDTRTDSLMVDCALNLTDEALLTLHIGRTPQPGHGSNVQFSGKLLVRTLEFDLAFDKSGDGSQLVGVYQNIGGGPNLLKELAGALVDAPEILDSLNFQVKSALLAYKNSVYQNTPGQAADKKRASLLLAADMDAGIDLSGLGGLPLVGKAFSDDAAIKLSFTPAYASNDWSVEDLGKLRGLLPTGAPTLPSGPLAPNTLALTTSIQIPGVKPTPLSLDLQAERPPQSQAERAGPPPNTKLVGPSVPSNVSWVDVGKSLAGIVHLHRVGVGYADGELILMLDAAVSIAGLSLGLYGLGASYNLSTHKLNFMLQGLGLDLSRPPMTISSAFMNFNGDFVGRAVLQMEQFGLTALGAFTTKLGPPSMFIYGFLNYPIGGPVFFFVEGLSAGFGFNRSLSLPDVSVIDQFPLVREAVESSSGGKAPVGPTEMASAQDIQQRIEAELIQLATYIAPSLGEYWVAVGLKFNSFRLIDVFALLTISFNANTYRLLISLLGVATIRIPPESPEVLANLQLNVKLTLDPLEGSLLALAEINRSSWILSPDCHLQGGFACGLWFLGEHAGDFVYTFGGYHPDFSVPAHYPRVPRLGLSWSISSAMSVKGSLYYAITPNALMAGGRMEATWHSGDLKAWFSFAADFLIQFKPFHYDARASVEIGASYEEAGLTISGSVSARLHLWGPNFSGSAHFSFGPVDFAVDFGDASGDAPHPISWVEFKKSFLPPQDGPSAKPLTTITVTNGLKATNKIRFSDFFDPLMIPTAGVSLSVPTAPTVEVEVAVVDPTTFALQTSTVIPVTSFWRGHQADSAESSAAHAAQLASLAFGVAPMNRNTPVVSTFQVTIELLSDHDIIDVTEEFTTEPIVKKFPAGLWGKGFQQANSSRTVDAPGGMTITPNDPTLPGGTSSMARSHLDYEPYRCELRRQADPGKTYSAWDRRSTGAMEHDRVYLREQLNSGSAARARSAALAALPPELMRSLDLDSARDVRLGKELADAFVIPPRVALAQE